MKPETYYPSLTLVNANSLESLIVRLVEIEPSEAPLLSCYVDLSKSREDQIAQVQQRGVVARSGLRGQERRDFDDALGEIIDYLRRRALQNKKSLAVFSRWGEEPIFVALELDAPIEGQLMADQWPMIYPLVALKDKLHRFVVVLTSENEARILEVVIGQVTESMLAKRPELRQRVGREWTKEHFQSHKRDRHVQFLKEKVALIEQLMSKKGYNHLIIMGLGQNVSRLTAALPKRIQGLVIDPKESSAPANLSEAVTEAIRIFLEAEERESQGTVVRLRAALMSNGLGVAGHQEVLHALLVGQADTLVILDDYPATKREELIRAAVLAKVNVETVGESELLEQYGGVGCLLRYRHTS